MPQGTEPSIQRMPSPRDGMRFILCPDSQSLPRHWPWSGHVFFSSPVIRGRWRGRRRHGRARRLYPSPVIRGRWPGGPEGESRRQDASDSHAGIVRIPTVAFPLRPLAGAPPPMTREEKKTRLLRSHDWRRRPVGGGRPQSRLTEFRRPTRTKIDCGLPPPALRATSPDYGGSSRHAGAHHNAAKIAAGTAPVFMEGGSVVVLARRPA